MIINYSNLDPKTTAQLANAKAIINADPDILNQIKSLAEFKRIFGFYLFSKGNRKLKPTKSVKFLIFNLPAVKSCPNATPECIKNCYAKRIERYDTPRYCRLRNYLLSLESWFDRLAICEIRLHLNTRGFKNADFIFVRIHESGDFYSFEYVLKWVNIARAFIEDRRVYFGLYTKSFSFFMSVDIPHNMTPSASLWNDTPETDRAMIADLVARGWQVYSADTAERIAERKKNGERFHVCTCADCGKCAYCYKPHKGERTDVVIH